MSPTQGMEFHEYSEEEKQEFREKPDVLLNMRKEAEKAMGTVLPLMIQGSMAQTQSRAYMAEQMYQKINNEELAKLLIPDFALGCRRLTVISSLASII